LARLASPVVPGPDICAYWVAPHPDGNDSNPGTAGSPWATLEHAAETIPDEGCTVWVEEGVYPGEQRINRRFTTPATFRAVRSYHAVLQNFGLVVGISGARNVTLQGFRFRHTGPGADPLVVQVDQGDGEWAEQITLRNNIFHDSYNNDLLKIVSGARFVTVEGNIFYNQGSGEEHIDVNSVTDVVIQDNIFFNDFAGSNRVGHGDAHSFITIKDSNENADGLEGSERITVRRNVFLNWEGRNDTFIQVGNDGKPYHEAEDVVIENNLMIGNAPVEVYATLGLRGVRNVTVANNTVVGDMPASAYAMWVSIQELNPPNENIAFYNNIWADPTGTMGSDLSGDDNKFSNGDPAQTNNLILENNLYWNGGAAVPPGDLLSPLEDDPHPIVANPLLNADQENVMLPRWNGSTFLSGGSTIRQEFVRLVEQYGRIPAGSPAAGRADPAFAPADDILGRPRSATPNLGAYERSRHTCLPLVLDDPSK
jgi:hypothetical protein